MEGINPPNSDVDTNKTWQMFQCLCALTQILEQKVLSLVNQTLQ